MKLLEVSADGKFVTAQRTIISIFLNSSTVVTALKGK